MGAPRGPCKDIGKELPILKNRCVVTTSACFRLKIDQRIRACCLAMFLTLLFVSLTFAETGTMTLEFGTESLSAQIERSSLRSVLEAIAEKEDIWIKGAEHLSEETYSVEFEDVSIREAVERMLSDFNCCYFLDPQGDLVGVIVVSKKSQRMGTRRNVPRRVFRGAKRR